MNTIIRLSDRQRKLRSHSVKKQDWDRLYPRMVLAAKVMMIRYRLFDNRLGRNGEPGEYVSDALQKYLSGERNYDEKNVPFDAFLYNTIRSLIGNDVKHLSAKSALFSDVPLENCADETSEQHRRHSIFVNDILVYLKTHASKAVFKVARVILLEGILSNKGIADYLGFSEYRTRCCRQQLMKLIIQDFPEIIPSNKINVTRSQ